ncbi:MAG: TRAP transporter large permease [Desulfarculales bacterium]|jgi:C4-dicarboxylate transporter DctM subunit|nr:TRAP transporter large permease [Desulfarculales bacterium]
MAFPLLAVFITALLIGVPIAVSLAGGAFGAMLAGGKPLFMIGQKLFASLDTFSLMAIPFFMLAGGIMSRGGASRRLVNFANALVGWMPGGLAMVTVLGSLFFGALSGSSTATVAAIGGILVPSLVEAGYDKRFAMTTAAFAGFLGVIIPPSMPMIVYGTCTGASIGKLFMAGFIPGILLAIVECLYCYWYGVKHHIPTQKFSLPTLVKTFGEAFGALLMPIIILGGIYGGVFTPTEAAAVSCGYGIIVCMLVYRELNFRQLCRATLDAVVAGGMIMFIIAAAGAFGYVMTTEQIPDRVAEFIISISDSKIVFFLLVNLLLLVVGCFLETTAAILILAPILYPVLPLYDIDPVHFGIVMIINLAIGMTTPPVGVNLFVAAGILQEKVEAVINPHLLIYIVLGLLVLALLAFVPEIVMFLPNAMRPAAF